MEQEFTSDLQVYDSPLGRRVRVTRDLCVICLVMLAVHFLAGMRPRAAIADETVKVLRLRGLVIEDEQGRPRILLGAPVPKVPGRKRHDDVYGLLVLGDNGADRAAVTCPLPEPKQAADAGLTTKGGGAAGVLVNDIEGNERGGYVAGDDGSVVLTLDGPKDEAITLGVDPKEPMSWIRLNDFDLLTPRTLITVRGNHPAKFILMNPNGKREQDIRVLRFSAVTSTRLSLRRGGGDKEFFNALDKIEP